MTALCTQSAPHPRLLAAMSLLTHPGVSRSTAQNLAHSRNLNSYKHAHVYLYASPGLTHTCETNTQKGRIRRLMGPPEGRPGKHFCLPLPLPRAHPTQTVFCFFYINDETIDDLLTFRGLFGRRKDNM